MEYELQQSPIRTRHGINTTVPEYSIGDWTPSIGGTATYNQQIGKWKKIGDVVWIFARLSINTRGTGSLNTVSGLPFPSLTYASGGISGLVNVRPVNIAVSVVFLYGVINTGTSSIIMQGLSAAGPSDTTLSAFGDGSVIIISGAYLSDQSY
jgi:hypothetical protein